MNLRSLCLFAFVIVGCTSGATGPVVMTAIECRLNSDCAVGSYCDSFTNLCGWDCRGDEECDVGEYCSDDNGRCLRSDAPPPVEPPPDMSPVLEITEIGDLSDMTLLAGTPDAEIIRFEVANRSERDVIIPTMYVRMDTDMGPSVTPVGAFSDIKFEDRSGRTVMGPSELLPGSGGALPLDDEFTIPAGESRTLSLRADIGTATGRYHVSVGGSTGVIAFPLYADTHEEIAADLIVNNEPVGRSVTISTMDEVIETPIPGTVSIFMENSGMRQTIDAVDAFGAQTRLFNIVVMNTTDETVRLSDLRIRVVADDGRPWLDGGVVALGAINVFDTRGSWVTAPPGASGCGGLGCTFIFDGPTLAPGEMTELEVMVRINTPGRTLFMAVGESFSSSPEGVTEAGAIFHRITNSAGDVLPAESIVGNAAGFYYVSSR